MYAAGTDNWSVDVKAEVDPDNREGDDCCVSTSRTSSLTPVR
jgi:hypothetical protein